MADIKQLERALMNADVAGDTEAARVLAGEIRRMRSQPAQADQPTAAQAPTQQQRDMTTPFARFARGIKDPLDALAQMAEQATPEPVRNALNSINNAGAKYGIFPKIPDGGVTQFVKDSEKEYQGAMQATGQGVDLMRAGGNIASPINYVPAARVAGAVRAGAGIGPVVRAGATSGALAGAMTPVTDDGDFATQKLTQAAVGGTIGGVIPAVGRGVSRVIRPQTNSDVRLLMSEGVTPTPGQILGGRAKSVEEKLASVPILGSSIRAGQTRANMDLNRAALERTIAPLGQKLPKDVDVGRDGIVYVEKVLKDSYDTVLDKIGAVRGDAKLAQDMQGLTSMFGNAAKPQEQADHLTRILDNEVSKRFNAQGFMTSEAMKKAQERIGSLAKDYKAHPDPDMRELGSALSEAQRSMREWVSRQSPKHAAELKKVDAGWANFKRVQRAASGVGAEEGKFTSAQLQSAIKAMDKSKDKGAFARGGALMQDLSEAGKNVLANKIPNSGTADRAMAAAMLAAPLAGGATMDPNYAYAALPALMFTRAGQNALARMLTSRPQSAQGVANSIEQFLPHITPALLPRGN